MKAVSAVYLMLFKETKHANIPTGHAFLTFLCFLQDCLSAWALYLLSLQLLINAVTQKKKKGQWNHSWIFRFTLYIESFLMQRCNTALVRQASVSPSSHLPVWESHTFDVHILNLVFLSHSDYQWFYLFINPVWFKHLMLYLIDTNVKSGSLLLFKQNKINLLS